MQKLPSKEVAAAEKHSSSKQTDKLDLESSDIDSKAVKEPGCSDPTDNVTQYMTKSKVCQAVVEREILGSQ